MISVNSLIDFFNSFFPSNNDSNNPKHWGTDLLGYSVSMLTFEGHVLISRKVKKMLA